MDEEKDIINEETLEEASENIAEEITEQAEAAAEDAENAAGAVEEEAEKIAEKVSEKKESTEKTFGRKLLDDTIDIVESTLVTIFIIGMIFTYLLHPVSVVGGSMNPTLKDSDKIMMSTVFFNLKYGDIIVVDNDKAYDIDENGDPVAVNIDGNRLKECIIKRVIATPGQEIDIRDGKAYVDGKELDEPYVMKDARTDPLTGFNGKYPFKVPDGYYFVMGDNREASSDSRDAGVGLIKKSQVYGKAILRYQPFDKFKFLFNSKNESAN
ncbi:MAG: signal peptidase I [Ruminococcus sp.]|nr:signal peptidase I [Ruminococcus sp.]